MGYKITLEVYVAEDFTWPTVAVETTREMRALARSDVAPFPSLLSTELVEDVLTRTREFAATLQRGEDPWRDPNVQKAA